MNRNVCIVTDTGADFPKTFKNVIKVPLHFIFGEKSYDDDNITNEEFDSKSALNWPTTSAPSNGEYALAYERAYELGFDRILCLPITRRLSVSYESAIAALDMVIHSNMHVEVIDTRSLTLGIGYLTEMLLEMIKGPSYSFQDLVKAASEFHKHETIFIALNTLENLEKGGRASHVQGLASRILNIKPILTVDDEGNLKVLEKVRTFSKTLDSVIEKVLLIPSIKKVGVMYSDNKGLAFSFSARLIEALNRKGVSISLFGVPVVQVCRALYVHAGRNAIGVCVIT